VRASLLAHYKLEACRTFVVRASLLAYYKPVGDFIDKKKIYKKYSILKLTFRTLFYFFLEYQNNDEILIFLDKFSAKIKLDIR